MELYCTKIVGSPILESPFPLRKVAWPGRTFCDCAKCASKKIIETTKVCRQPNWMVEGKSWWSKSVKNRPLFSSSWSNGIQWRPQRCACWYCCGVDAACGAALVIAVAVGCLRCLKHLFCRNQLGLELLELLTIFCWGGGAFESSKHNYYKFTIVKINTSPWSPQWLQLAQLARVKLPNCAVPGLGGGGGYHGITVSPGICPTAESLRPKRTIGVRRGIKAIFRILEITTSSETQWFWIFSIYFNNCWAT